MDKQFIVTKSKETAALLLRSKFTLVTDADEQWVFVNDPAKMTFSKLEDLRYTNKLYI